MRLDCFLLVFNAVRQKVQRMPAGNKGKTVWCQCSFQCLWLGWHLVAFFDAVEADFTGFFEALLQRNVRTESTVVVIAPCNWVGSVTDHWP